MKPDNSQGKTRKISRVDVDQVLEKVEEINVDDANLLRGYLAMLESQLRIYQLEADLSSDDEIGWSGALDPAEIHGGVE